MSKRRKSFNKREISLILLLRLTVLFLAGWKISGTADLAEIKEQLEQQKLIKQESNRLSEIIAQKDIIEVEWTEWQEEQERLNKTVPDRTDLPNVLGNLEDLLNQFHGAVHTLRVGETTDHQQYNSTVLTLSVSDQPDKIRALLHSLENFPHLLIIDSIAWTVIEDGFIKTDLDFRLFYINSTAIREAVE